METYRSLILLDEDERRVQEVRTLLEPLACPVLVAEDAADAERRLGAESTVSLVLLGAGSPRHDPLELARRLRAAAGFASLPVLFLTDPEAHPFDVGAAYALGAVDELPRSRLAPALAPKVRLLLATDVRAHERTLRELRGRVKALEGSNRRKRDFLATLAHELRGPLAPLRNGLELLRLGGDDPAELEAVRSMMSRQLDQLVGIVDDLLDVTRVALDRITLRKERVDLRTVLATALESVGPQLEEKGHALVLDVGAEALPTEVDPVRMVQVIGNLLGNAVKYTPPGGRIRVRVEVREGEILLAVEDSGVGIPQAALPGVFDMFNRVPGNEASADGLGVGLALVRRLLTLHGGSVEASSPGPGLGSTFRIRLPLSPSPRLAATGAGSVRDTAPVPVRFRILIVEDDAEAGATLAKVLQREQQVTCLARSGAEALHIAATFRPSIVLMDLGLPDIDGHDLAPKLRALGGLQAPVVVALSGHASESERARSRAAGIDRHLPEPTSIETLRRLLVEVAELIGARENEVVTPLPAPRIAGLEGGGGFSMPATRAFMRDCIATRSVAMSIADARLPDYPLVVVNRAFTELTGYPEADVVGTNCRFLQGRDRDQEGVRRLSRAMREGRDIEVFLHNVTRSGKPFVNLLRLYMLRDAHGTVRFVLGSQLEAVPESFEGRSSSESNAAVDLLTDTDRYPTLLPERYRSLYRAEAAIADDAAARLRAHVSRLR